MAQLIIMDINTILGLVIGIGGILVGNLLEGGQTGSLIQFTAGFIVFSGTLGATLVSNSQKNFQLGIKLLVKIFKDHSHDDDEFNSILREIVDCTRSVKRDSVIALESKIGKIKNEFLVKILRTIIDGTDPDIAKETFYTEIDSEEEHLLSGVKIWSDAGGFAPTIGILGAVLGLIHVMGHLTDTSKLGTGIAVAFVATVYGVGLANLVFIPFSNKLKKYVEDHVQRKKIILEGALLINSGLSSHVVDQRLQAFLDGKVSHGKKKSKA